jgi:hypothetical protein
MLRPLFSKVAGRLLALTSESCDGFAREQSETVWGSQMSSMKLSSRSSLSAKLRPISKRKLSSFPRSLKDRSATDRRVYEVRPRKDHRGVDLISDALSFVQAMEVLCFGDFSFSSFSLITNLLSELQVVDIILRYG